MELTFELLRADNTALLSQCLRRVYGDTYPIPEFYDAGYVRELIEARKLYTVVAQTATGEVVGSMSTALEMVGDVTADGSALMVDKAYRGHGVVGGLGKAMVSVYNDLELAGLHLYALALHDLVQNQSGRAGAVVTGVLPAWFTERAQVDGYPYPPGKRIGAVTLYLPMGQLPQRACYLPARYASVLSDIYQRLDAPRELLAASAVAPEVPTSACELECKTANRQLRLVVSQIGSDIGQRVRQLVVNRGADNEVLYLDLPLADAAIDVAVNCAVEAGFFYGALMVDRCGGDRLRLQYYDPELAAPGAMVIASAEGRALRDLIVLESRS